MVVMLGCILGLLFVFWTVSLIASRDTDRRAHSSVSKRLAMAPVRLSEEAVRNELIEVIQSQLAAFRKNDYPKAYKYAAANIREQVPLPAFERMVRTGFPVMARSSSAEFGVILDNGSAALVNVSIVSKSGRLIRYQYSLRHELAGWRINGVMRMPFEGTFV